MLYWRRYIVLNIGFASLRSSVLDASCMLHIASNMSPPVRHQNLHLIDQTSSATLLSTFECGRRLPLPNPPPYSRLLEPRGGKPAQDSVFPTAMHDRSCTNPGVGSTVPRVDGVVCFCTVTNAHVGIQPHAFRSRERVVCVDQAAF